MFLTVVDYISFQVKAADNRIIQEQLNQKVQFLPIILYMIKCIDTTFFGNNVTGRF